MFALGTLDSLAAMTTGARRPAIPAFFFFAAVLTDGRASTLLAKVGLVSMLAVI